MSKIKTVLVTDVPEFFQLKPDGTVAREMSEKGGFTCPRCNGSGRVIVEDNMGHDGIEQCPVCLGYGVLKARIVTEWLPDVPFKK